MSFYIDRYNLFSKDSSVGTGKKSTDDRRFDVIRKKDIDQANAICTPTDWKFLREHRHLPNYVEYRNPLDIVEPTDVEGQKRNRGGRPKGSKDTKKRKSREQQQ